MVFDDFNPQSAMHCNVHSAFSLRYGTLSIDQLIALALEKGHTAIALTDINNTSAALEFVGKARANGIKPIVGIEFRVDNRLYYIGLARNDEGFHALNAFLSKHLHDAALALPGEGAQADKHKPEREPTFHLTRTGDELLPEGPGSALPGNLRNLQFPDRAPALANAVFIYPFDNCPPAEALGDNAYVGIMPTQLRKLVTSPLRHHPHKLVCLLPVTFASKVGYNTHRLLRAIDRNILLSKQDPLDLAAADEYMYSPADIQWFYKDHPAIVANTVQLMEGCHFNMSLKRVKNKRHFTNSERNDLALLRKLAHTGFKKRYGPHDETAQKRFEGELKVIDEMGFCPYYLITLDFVNYAKSCGYYHVGRGSGANSIIAYCLGITEVDPVELNLFFERFLNVHRTSPPDFDIDFSWADRDELIDYIFKRHGHAHTAFVATYVCFHGRSIIRELGKVFGLAPEEIDKLIANRQAPDLDDKVVKAIYRYAEELEGLPNYLGMHPGGILISDKPIHCYSATSVPPKGFPVVHFDMFGAEEVGLFKFDVLSQRGLGDIRSALEIIRTNKGKNIDITDVKRFMRDPKIATMLATGNTLGVFYVGSPAMRQLLRKLACDNYPTLVAASSVIRPGVAKSGMMRQYIERHLISTQNPLPTHTHTHTRTHTRTAWYLDPSMEEYLGETYGVMIYQEDVLKVAHYYAGIGLGEADVLRRAMSGKYRSFNEFKSLKDKFFEGAREKGRDEATAHEVWRQMESFAGYSFCKAHSASYAVESYQGLFLKAHYPLEYLTSVINNFGGYYRTEVYLLEIRRQGGKVHAPCINQSEYLATITGDNVYLGFVHMKGLQKDVAKAIVQARQKGPYTGLGDLLTRVPSMGLEQATLLIRVGALRFTGKSKKNLLWEVGMHFSKAPALQQTTRLFQVEEVAFDLPSLSDSPIADGYDELEILGFPLISPFAMTLEQPMAGEIHAANFQAVLGQQVTITGYLISTKTVRTVKGTLMGFADFMDRKGNFFDATLFPDTYQQNATPSLGVYSITGKIIQDFGVPSLEVAQITRLGYKPDPRYT